MQRAVLALCTLLLFQAAGAVAQPKVTVVGGLSFDFGTLHSTKTVKRLIPVRNDGTDTLVIKEVGTACGCTAAMIAKRAIAPGDSGVLEIAFDPRKFTGKVEKPVSLSTNDPANPKPHIKFTATIEKLVDVTPEYIIFRASPGVPATEHITITNLSSAPIRITAVRSPSPLISTDAKATTIAPGAKIEVPLTLTVTRTGAQSGDIVVETDQADIAELPLRFFSLVTDAPSSADSGK